MSAFGGGFVHFKSGDEVDFIVPRSKILFVSGLARNKVRIAWKIVPTGRSNSQMEDFTFEARMDHVLEILNSTTEHLFDLPKLKQQLYLRGPRNPTSAAAPSTAASSSVTSSSAAAPVPTIASSVSQLALSDIKSVGGSSEDFKMNLRLRLNLRDSEPKKLNNLKKIQDLTGVSFSVDVNVGEIKEALSTVPSAAADMCDTLADMIFARYLSGLAWNIGNYFGQDSSLRPKFAEKLSGKSKIAFRLVLNENAGFAARTRIDDGVLMLEVSKAEFGSDPDSLGNDISDALQS